MSAVGRLALCAVLSLAGVAACSLNPQPLPPDQDDSLGDSEVGRDPDSGATNCGSGGAGGAGGQGGSGGCGGGN
jgi:hypothetical protein